MTTRDRIVVKKIAVFAYHGLYEEEARLGQASTSASNAGWISPRRAERTTHEGVSYADLVGTVQEIAVGERFQIIEALAERIAATILAQQPLIEAISVTVEKPAAAIAALSRRSRSPSTGARAP